MRVFVSVGNAHQPFDALMVMVEEAFERVGRPVSGTCQHGYTARGPRQLAERAFLPVTEFEREINEADAVILHGGSGAISYALRAGHVPLVMPRRVARGEHVDDHQLEIVGALAREGKVIPVESAPQMAEVLARFATGELRRGLRRAPSADALALVEAAMGGASAKGPSRIGHLVLRCVALLGPRPKRVA